MPGMAEHRELLPDPLPAEPLAIVSEWLAQARAAGRQPNPNSMVLATSTPSGRPSARVVLCKHIAPQPGFLVFYTNYESRKAIEIASQPRAAALFHWDALHRQVRIEGPVVKSPPRESDDYFASRPWPSRRFRPRRLYRRCAGHRRSDRLAVTDASRRRQSESLESLCPD